MKTFLSSLLASDQRTIIPEQQFSSAALGGLIALVVLLLLPMLSYPLGPDNGLFFVSGQKIVSQGAVPYRDIVDVKPPLIYYTNALAIAVFGDNPVSIRILDLLLQLLTCFFLFKLIRSATKSDVLGGLSAVLYVLLYIGLNFANTAQVESAVGLLGLPAVYLFLFRRKPFGFMLIGLLCGILTFYKFTLGITLAGFLISDLLLYNNSWRTRIRNYSAMATGFGAVVLVFVLYLVLFDAAHGFANMQTFLSGYTGIQWSEKGALLRTTLKNLPVALADQYSLTMLFGTFLAIGSAISVLGKRTDGPSHRIEGTIETTTGQDSKDGTKLLQVCAIMFVLLLGTVALEAKWLHYHILRFFPFGAILGAFGIVRMVGFVAAKQTDRFRVFLLPTLAVLFLTFSPITRYVFHLRPAFAMLLHGPEAFDEHYAHVRESDTWTLEEIKGIGSVVRSKYQAGDKVFISSGIAGMVYLQCNYVPDLPIFHSGFLIAPFAPDEWRDTTRTFLLQEQPRFVIIQKSDRMHTITSVQTTSPELIHERMPDVETMLQTAYTVIEETPAFVVYEKRSGERE